MNRISELQSLPGVKRSTKTLTLATSEFEPKGLTQNFLK